MLKKYAEFIFIDAPHKPNLPTEPEQDKTPQNNREDPRAWWFSRADQQFSSRDVTELDDGFTETVQYVLDFIKKEGPFDGIVAFSQGAALAFLLLALERLGKVDLKLRCVILVSAFPSLSSKHKELVGQEIVGIPSLHVFGSNDQTVNCDISRRLAEKFVDPPAICIEHTGGHFIPTLTPYKQTILEYMEKLRT